MQSTKFRLEKWQNTKRKKVSRLGVFNFSSRNFADCIGIPEFRSEKQISPNFQCVIEKTIFKKESTYSTFSHLIIITLSDPGSNTYKKGRTHIYLIHRSHVGHGKSATSPLWDKVFPMPVCKVSRPNWNEHWLFIPPLSVLQHWKTRIFDPVRAPGPHQVLAMRCLQKNRARQLRQCGHPLNWWRTGMFLKNFVVPAMFSFGFFFSFW